MFDVSVVCVLGFLGCISMFLESEREWGVK